MPVAISSGSRGSFFDRAASIKSESACFFQSDTVAWGSLYSLATAVTRWPVSSAASTAAFFAGSCGAPATGTSRLARSRAPVGTRLRLHQV